MKPRTGNSEFSFALDEKTRRALGHQLIEIINGFYSSLPDRTVQVPLEQRSFAPLSNAMPERGGDPARALEEVSAAMIAEGFHVPSANYFGLMNPAPTYVAVLAEALVAALNPQLATQNRSQLATKIEDETVRWIGERVGWKVPFGGTFTSGGNEANFSALALALTKHFPNIVEDGLASIGAQPVLYASTESHHSLDKSAGLLGLGRKALRRIPVTATVQMDLALLESEVAKDKAAGHKPLCVVATAGTTNSGAIDDLTAIAAICRRHNLWLHVDGAYGPPLSSPISIAISSKALNSPTPSPSTRINGWPCPLPPESWSPHIPNCSNKPLAPTRPTCPKPPAPRESITSR